MKWRLYSTPEFMKILTTRNLYTKENISEYNKYRKFEYGMYVFIDWVGKKLDKIYRTERKFIPGETYELQLDLSSVDDISTIKEFCQFYIRMVRDPLTGKCVYASKLNIPQDSNSACFKFVNKPLIYDSLNAISFIISGLHIGKSREGQDSYVKIYCIDYN